MPIDVLMLQLGTPAAPTAAAIRPYLREFLNDPRILEFPAPLRWLLVNLVIAPFRAPKSAAKYLRIWDSRTGSPLLSITQRQRDALGATLGADYRVWFGMRYGQPSISSVVREMMDAGCERLVVLPMYPQYSATTTASSLDALFDAMRKERVVPAMRIIRDYPTDDAYIQAIAVRINRSLDEAKASGVEPEIHLISFHGIPKVYIDKGDPYRAQSTKTALLLAERMGWSEQQWKLVFQSRLGRQEWLTPYTDETLVELASQGVKRVLVVQPGFTADCLETIDEIGHEGRMEFQTAGGKELVRVPCLNDDPEFISALANLVRQEAQGWP